MLKRWMIEKLLHKLDYRRGVHLTGDRQIGKSTLAEMVERSNCRRYTLDMKKIREVAANDPYGFVKHASGNVSQGDFTHLKWFANNLAKTPFTGIVLYSGKDVLRYGEGFYAVPLSALG